MMSIALPYTARRTCFRLGSHPTLERGNNLLYKSYKYIVSRCGITRRRIFLIRVSFLLLLSFLAYILDVGGILLYSGNLYIPFRGNSV